ncbi:AI-2E family transporter [uncultured Slackia sp.]|uniref:AI-2E family transporter n=1 Tax=uncultured Slackia sp. TaxID=665903 RepID=UPI0025EB1E59|nr:AI-2E family transporter [uncultured Slackia sp.]
MAEEKKRALRRAIWMVFAAFLLFVAAMGVVYSKQVVAASLAVWTAVLPLLLGCIIAYVLNLIMGRLERIYFPKSENKVANATRRPVCLILSIAIIAAIVAIIVNLVFPQIRASWDVLENGVMMVAQNAYSWGEQNEDALLSALGAGGLDNLRESFTKLFESLSSGSSEGTSQISSILTTVFSTVYSIAHGVFIGIVAVVFSLYILIDKERVINGARAAVDLLLPQKGARAVRHAAHVANDSFSRFITGQCIEAVILGTLCAIGMTIFGMPYAPAVGACVGMTALVPVFGAWLGGAVGFLMILTVDPMMAVWFVVFLIILQQIESHLIYPNVVGASVGLPGIWVFAAVLVGGALFGVLGMFLGVPAVATVRTLVIERAAKMRAAKAQAAKLERVSTEEKPSEEGAVQ